MKNKQKGITLIALIVTIIVLLILAGITIGTLTGENGLIVNSKKAKEQTEILNEKEIVEQATTEAMGKGKYGTISKENLKQAIEKITGEGKVEIGETGKGFEVGFIESKRYYAIDENRNVGDYQIAVQDPYPGDIKKDANGNTLDGSEEYPFEINCIEDLVTFSIMTNGGNTELEIESNNFTDKYVVLNRTLNFESIFSYKDNSTTKYGDLNLDGQVEDIKTELTKTDDGCVGFTAIKGFQGTFDGKENTIKNIYQYKESTDNVKELGLFIRGGVIIKNLNLTGNIINKVGVASTFYSGTGGTGKIINCENYANVTGIDFTCGIGYNCIYIDGCINYGKIVNENMSGSYYGASGIGYGNWLKIINCINEGEIITNGKWGWYNLSGGITCTSLNNTIQNCINKGKCDAGIIGWIKKDETYIENCYDIGECSYAITGPGVGEVSKNLTNLYYQTDISTAPSIWDDYVTGLTEKEMKNNPTFVETLNNNRGENTNWKQWKMGEDGYPTF